MPVTKWIIDQGRLALSRGDRPPAYPNAMDIYKLVFYETGEVDGNPCPSIREHLPNLLFSRIPASPAIRLTSEAGTIKGELGVLASKIFVATPYDRDQLVHNGEWFPIQLDELHSVRISAEQRGLLGSNLRISSLIKHRTCRDPEFTVIDNAATTSQDLVGKTASPNEVVGIKATLYPYQMQGVRFLKMIAEQELGCILADEMGLGKTLQIIAMIQAELNKGLGPSLVVAPATLLENWRREIATFAPAIKVKIHAGSDRPGIAARLAGYDVVVTSYDTVVRDETLLSGINWHVVILDEAQAIKNPHAQRTTAVKRLPRDISIAVSGTPLENRVDDLWSVTDFCLPGLLGTLEEFRSEFSDDLNDAARLAPVVGPLILRRRVAEVAKDLPEKIEIMQAVEISEKMAVHYESTRKSVIEEHGVAGALVATTILRSFCAHPSLVEAWSDDPADEMTKYVRLLELLEEIFTGNEKVLIFSTFQGVADIFERDLPRRFPGGFYKTIDGRTAITERQGIVDAFFSYHGYGALFLNPKAAGTGLNITAANHVIHYNPEWNPALTAQATGRAFRRKQTRPVTVHHLFFPSTVEEVIIERAAFKQQLAINAVGGHGGDGTASDLARALDISPLVRRGGAM